MSSALASRITSGGISKRGSSRRTQVDNDGDLDMDNPSGGRGGRNNRRGGRGGGAGGRGGRSVNLNNAPRGPAADRRSGKGSGAGRDTRRDPAGTRPSNRRTTVADNTVPVKVEGWINSKRTVDETVKFLERKTKLKFPKVCFP